MDKRLWRAPDAEWVLMYRLGLSRRRIAEPHPSPTDLARIEEVTAWISAEGRLPNDRSGDRDERSMARWLSLRRREAAEGTLDPAYSHGLAQVTGWAENRREAADEAKWHAHLAALVGFRQEGHDWPRHHDYDSEREHTLGVWIHAQRYKRRRGQLDPVKLKLLDDAVPGWQAGRTRGRPPRR